MSDSIIKKTPDSALAEVAALARLYLIREQAVAEAEAVLSKAKERFREVSEVDLPEAMRECGLQAFTLTDGSKISVSEDLSCSIPVANREIALAWLKNHGFGGLIKANVNVAFPASELQTAEKLASEIVRNDAWAGAVVALEQTVHPSTLKAFLKEQMREHQPVPLDTFGARAYTKAKLTQPKMKGV